MLFTRLKRGVTPRFTIDADTLRSAEARRLDSVTGDLQSWFSAPARLAIKNREPKNIAGPAALIDAIIGEGRHNLTIQPYKGLGEMNPDQLWETTLNPEARSLLQVRVNQIDEAEQVFSTLWVTWWNHAAIHRRKCAERDKHSTLRMRQEIYIIVER
jgi:DNA gyrase subunit B